jgi:hypothetical protein
MGHSRVNLQRHAGMGILRAAGFLGALAKSCAAIGQLACDVEVARPGAGRRSRHTAGTRVTGVPAARRGNGVAATMALARSRWSR